MPVTRTDALEAILMAMLDRLGTATGDASGNVDEATQEDVDTIAALADGPVLGSLVEDLNRLAPAAVHDLTRRRTGVENESPSALTTYASNEDKNCGTGAGGFGYDNTCWRGGQAGSFASHHDIPIMKGGTEPYSHNELRSLFEEHAKDGGRLKVQTMAEPQAMKMVRFGNTEWRWAEGQLDRVVKDARLAHKVPEVLRNAVDHVTYTSQRDSDEALWKKKFNDDNIVIRASGGHGSTVSWNGYNMGSGTYAHEAGHSLAEKLWGDVTPPRSSEYAKAQKLESPVTKYGATAPAEDFAEACKLYTRDEAAFKESFPKKHAALDRILRVR
jgi:hypothetical protein